MLKSCTVYPTIKLQYICKMVVQGEYVLLIKHVLLVRRTSTLTNTSGKLAFSKSFHASARTELPLARTGATFWLIHLKIM